MLFVIWLSSSAQSDFGLNLWLASVLECDRKDWVLVLSLCLRNLASFCLDLVFLALSSPLSAPCTPCLDTRRMAAAEKSQGGSTTVSLLLWVEVLLPRLAEVYHGFRKPPGFRRISQLPGKLSKQWNHKLKKKWLFKLLHDVVSCYTEVANWYMRLRAVGLGCLLIFPKRISLYRNTLSLPSCCEAKMCTLCLRCT